MIRMWLRKASAASRVLLLLCFHQGKTHITILTMLLIPFLILLSRSSHRTVLSIFSHPGCFSCFHHSSKHLFQNLLDTSAPSPSLVFRINTLIITKEVMWLQLQDNNSNRLNSLIYYNVYKRL